MDVKCKMCGSGDSEKLIKIDKKPDVEVDYGIPEDAYERLIFQCKNCGVYFNHHELLDFEKFYDEKYNLAIDQNGLKNRFDKIINLPPEQSDNKIRVERIVTFLKSQQEDINDVQVLDVGSGTGVFSYEMKKYVNHVHIIDPDLTSVKHAREVVEVTGAHHGDLFNYDSDIRFDLITFNKVLEHVDDPVSNLKAAKKILKKNGLVYVELPEGDRIADSNSFDQRAEFAVEHITIFNPKSMSSLARMAGFSIIDQEVVTDPSGKFTIWAFLT